MGHVVERPAPHPPRLDPADLADARHHLPRRLVGEGEQQELLGRRAGLDQARDAIGERARLARAGAGDDQGGPRLAEGNGALLVGEIAVVVDQSLALRRRGFQRISAYSMFGGLLLGESGLDGHRRPP